MDRDDREHFKTMSSASAGQPTGSKTGSSAKASQPSRHDPHSCLAKARAIFSCYRRDEAQDPDGFVANLALVLGDYPASIVDLAADPRTGIITAFPMGLPNVGQIRQFLEDKLSHREKLARLAALPKPEFVRGLPRPVAGPGAWANVLLRPEHPMYARFIERAKTADPREFEFTNEGIRVSLAWLERPADHIATKHFKVPSEEFLRELYPAKPAAQEGEAA